MILLAFVITFVLLLASFFLEEAVAWTLSQTSLPQEENGGDPEPHPWRHRASVARNLSLFLWGAGMLVGFLAVEQLGNLYAPMATLGAVIVLALFVTPLLAVHGRSPLVIGGRVLLLPFRAALEKVVAFADGFLTSISESLSVEDWRNRMDQEILWLHGGGDTNEVDEVLASIHEFGTTMVDDVMVPRGDVVGISVDATVEEARVLAKQEGFSRYPVYRDSMDNVVGVLHVLDLLHANPKDTIKGLARDPLITNATKSVERLLSEFQGSYNQLAVVADEFGGIAGIATVEDLLEELVGEIHDETDNKENPVRRVEAGVYIVEATARVDELNESLGLNLPEGEYDTLGGLVLERLERIPRIGERLQEDEVGIEVAAAEPNRIHTIRLTVRKETAKRHDG